MPDDALGGALGKVAPVQRVSRLDVTDPWGEAWGMDSPYDASIAYASNPHRLALVCILLHMGS